MECKKDNSVNKNNKNCNFYYYPESPDKYKALNKTFPYWMFMGARRDIRD